MLRTTVWTMRPIGPSEAGTRGHSRDQRQDDDLRASGSGRAQSQPSKSVLLAPALLTGETSKRFDGDHLVPDDRRSCKGPPPDCRRIV